MCINIQENFISLLNFFFFKMSRIIYRITEIFLEQTISFIFFITALCLDIHLSTIFFSSSWLLLPQILYFFRMTQLFTIWFTTFHNGYSNAQNTKQFHNALPRIMRLMHNTTSQKRGRIRSINEKLRHIIMYRKQKRKREFLLIHDHRARTAEEKSKFTTWNHDRDWWWLSASRSLIHFFISFFLFFYY